MACMCVTFANLRNSMTIVSHNHNSLSLVPCTHMYCSYTHLPMIPFMTGAATYHGTFRKLRQPASADDHEEPGNLSFNKSVLPEAGEFKCFLC